MIGNYVTAAFVILYFVITAILCRGVRLHARDIAFGALACALTVLLSYLYIPIPGGSSFSMALLPLMMLSLLYDPKVAMLSGLACGVLSMFVMPGWAPVHWAQIPVEHLLCFSALGYAGIFGRETRGKRVAGVLLASGIKMVGHVVSGVLFFSQNAWEGFGPWAYSIGYNVPPTTASAILMCVLVAALPIDSMARAIPGRSAA